MAFRRSLTARAKFFYQQQQRLSVPLLHTDRHDNDDRRRQSYKGGDYLRRCLPGDNWGSFSGSRNLVGDRRFAIPAALAPVFVRNMSTEGVGVVAEKAIEEAVAPVANEVAAAVSGIFPLDVFQYLIDHVHTSTGFNWWASIASCALLIRALQLPSKIYQLKAVSKFTHIQPQLDEIEDEIESGNKSTVAVALLEARKKKLLNEYGIKPLTKWATFLTGVPVTFFFFYAILNMTQKVESFKEGGAFWFTDLTTPDATYILPALTAFTYWMAMECHRYPRFGDGLPKSANVIIAALAFPLAAFAPK
ncbi:hypothetical protein C2S51_016364, partial [Perilla frutescens var. frutescens]